MPSLTMEMTYDDLMPEDLSISAWSHVLPILGLCHSCKLPVETATSCSRLIGLPISRTTGKLLNLVHKVIMVLLAVLF